MRTVRNSSSIGSISGEWNAWLTRSRRVLIPWRSRASAAASTAVCSPETTTESGALTAAIATTPPISASTDVTCASEAWTEVMAPPSGSVFISRPRAATSAAASGSDSTSAAYAAVISPTECPARWSGWIPQAVTCRYSADSNANSAACVNTVRPNTPANALLSAANITSRTEAAPTRASSSPRCGSNAAQASSRASRKTGNAW